MSANMEQEPQLINQSRILFNAGNTRYTVYSNTVSTPIIGPVLKLSKCTDAALVVPGQPIQYTLSLSNTGNYAAEVVVSDGIPAGMSFVPNSVSRCGVPVPGADPGAGISLGAVNSGEMVGISFQLVLQYTRDGAYPPMITNEARAVYSFRTAAGRLVTDQVCSNKLTLPVQPVGKPILHAKLSVNKECAVPGDTVQYSLLLSNIGERAGDIVLGLEIPKGTLFIRNSITVNGQRRCGDVPASGLRLGHLPPKASIIVTYEVSIPGFHAASPGQVIVNQLRATASYTSGNRPALEEAVSNTVTTKLCFPVLRAEMCANPDIIELDDQILITGRLTNSGNAPALVFASRLHPNQLLLVPGSLRVNGQPEADPEPGGKTKLGMLQPGESIELCFWAAVSPFAVTRFIRGAGVFPYTYVVNGCEYSGEVTSNHYMIQIEYGDE